MSEESSREMDVCCDCFILFTISVNIPKRNPSVYMLAKYYRYVRNESAARASCHSCLSLIAGKRLISDEGGYKGLEITCSFLFLFITYCLSQSTKISQTAFDGVTKICMNPLDDCGLARRSQKTWKI